MHRNVCPAFIAKRNFSSKREKKGFLGKKKNHIVTSVRVTGERRKKGRSPGGESSRGPAAPRPDAKLNNVSVRPAATEKPHSLQVWMTRGGAAASPSVRQSVCRLPGLPLEEGRWRGPDGALCHSHRGGHGEEETEVMEETTRMSLNAPLTLPPPESPSPTQPPK